VKRVQKKKKGEEVFRKGCLEAIGKCCEVANACSQKEYYTKSVKSVGRGGVVPSGSRKKGNLRKGRRLVCLGVGAGLKASFHGKGVAL